MPLNENERVQEAFLLIGDRLAPIQKKWWYALVITLAAIVPMYFLFKFGFIWVLSKNHKVPAIVYSAAIKEPISIIDKKILNLSTNTYSGFVKVRNINHEWGINSQPYTIIFETTGGTVLHQISSATFILPSSEKIILVPRFSSAQKPDVLKINFGESKFVRKPIIDSNLEVERVNLQNSPSGLVVNAGVKNLTAFNITRVDLLVVVYDAKNEIVAVNSTYINDLETLETRSFQYTWPTVVSGAVRAEINPEINIFDRNIFTTQEGVSPF